MANREHQKSAHAAIRHGGYWAEWTLTASRPAHEDRRGREWGDALKSINLILATADTDSVKAIRLNFSDMDKARALRDQLTEFIDWVEEPFLVESRE